MAQEKKIYQVRYHKLYLFTGLKRSMNSKPSHRKRLQGAVDATCGGRSSKSEAPGAGHADVLLVLQMPGNKADAVPCERLP
jgi:hypothetical protein